MGNISKNAQAAFVIYDNDKGCELVLYRAYVDKNEAEINAQAGFEKTGSSVFEIVGLSRFGAEIMPPAHNFVGTSAMYNQTPTAMYTPKQSAALSIEQFVNPRPKANREILASIVREAFGDVK